MSAIDVRAIDEAGLEEAKRPVVKQELAVFLSEEAFDRMVARGDSDTTREIGGVLVGEVKRDAAGPYLDIATTIDALHADEKGAELTFTHATWEHINNEMDTKHQGKRVVGWYHTHPGFGVFLSDRDQFIHKSFFDQPFQVAFVYDPKSKDHGIFAWRDNETWRLRRYAIGKRDHTWDGNRTTAQPEKEKDKQAAGDKERDRDRDRDRRRDDEEPIFGSSLAPYVMVAVVLMLIAAFIGHWFGRGSADAVVRQAQLQVAQSRATALHDAVKLLDAQLVEVLRTSLSDDAMRAPAQRAVAAIDEAILALRGAKRAATPGTAPTTPTTATPGTASAPTTPPTPGTAAAPTTPPTTAAAPTPTPPTTPEARIDDAIARLEVARAKLVRVHDDRLAAAVILQELTAGGRSRGPDPAELARDVAAQRNGLGQVYAELAADAVKAGDKDRARRLLHAAVRIDPGERARYEKQLQSFAKGERLPVGEPGGAARPELAPPGPGSVPPAGERPAPPANVEGKP